MQPTSARLSWINNYIADILENDYRNNKLSKEQAESISGYIIEQLPGIQTDADVLQFVWHLAEIYPGFQSLKQVLQAEQESEHGPLELLRQGAVKEARLFWLMLKGEPYAV